MFVHLITLKLKQKSPTELNRIIESKIVPLLREQKGFRDEVSCVAIERAKALLMTFWDTRENAEDYNRSKHSDIVRLLSNAADEDSRVETFQVTNTTLHKMAAKGA